MKAFLQSTMTVLLGLSLLYAFYQKKTGQPQVIIASDIEMDSLFFVDQQAFKTKLLAVNQLNTEAILLKAESLEKADSVKPITTITDYSKKRKEKPKLEIYELRKAPKTNLANSQSAENRLTNVISSKLIENAPSETVTASMDEVHSTTEAVSSEQPQVEKKKKFLFFSKKSKN